MSNLNALDGRCLVIIPTKNEAKNITGIVDKIIDSYPFDVLIVDDMSIDGTRTAIEGNARFNLRLFILKRNSEFGLGKAYIDGFKWAINNSKYRYIFQMDGDGFHLPEELPKLIDPSKDCVIASRWTGGSTIDENWPLLRKLVSWILNFVVKLSFSFPVFDSSSGFRFIRISALRKIDFDNFISKGYSFQQEVLLNILSKGGRVVEKSVHFGYRIYGKSKVNWRIISELIYVLVHLFIREIRRKICALKKKHS